MRFIQDKLNGLGRVSYTIKDTTPRKTQIQTVILEYRDVVVDPNQCRISIHVKATSQITNKDITHSVPGEWNIRSQDLVYSLRSDVQDIEVKPLVSQDDKIESISQPITSLVLHLRQGGVDSLAFTDAALANRVGFAMRHAIELCGGHHVTNSGMSASVNANVPRRVSISADVMGDMLIANTTPVYPPIAKAARISGTVVLQATISNTGSVENLRVISGPAMLQQASLDAVKTWRYRPYLINGEPVEVETTVNVIFTLGG
jgi:TonB family protein